VAGDLTESSFNSRKFGHNGPMSPVEHRVVATPVPPLTGIGLVLGAGGTTGAAFHAGTLLALQHDLGWNPNSADVIVGSSAGSIVGGLLRAGLTTDDLAAWGASVPALPGGRATRELLNDVEAQPHRIRPPKPRLPRPSTALLRRLLHPSGLRMHTAALSLLPQGWINAAPSLERIGELLDDWPLRALWITAVRTSDARRMVFGRDDIDVSLGRAIAASCAIPAVFRPVAIGGHRYIDGGAHSPTNADLLVEAGVDTAVIVSPMSGIAEALRRHRPDHLLRSLFSRRLRSECAQLERAGIEVHVFEPDAATLDMMGINALDRRRSPRVLRDAFLAAGTHITDNEPLRTRLLAQAVGSEQMPGTSAMTVTIPEGNSITRVRPAQRPCEAVSRQPR
jgi:NTE family protein